MYNENRQSKAWTAVKRNPVISYIKKYAGVLGALFVMAVALTLGSDRFLTTGNIINVLRQISINAIIAFGMTFCILIGGIDLSVGSICALSGVVVAVLLSNGMSIWLAIALALLVGLASGLFNGLIMSLAGIPPFVVTLCSMTVAKGVAYVATNGKPVSINSDAFNFIGNGYLFDTIPIPVLLMLACFFLCAFLLNKTKFGKYVYAIGGNRDAAKYSGINLMSVEVRVFVISGVLAALSGIILAARMYSGQPTSGEGYELDAIAAVVIGGTSMTGGIGAVGGTILGALVIGIMNNGLNLLRAQYYLQTILKGVIILAAVSFDMARNRMRMKRQVEEARLKEEVQKSRNTNNGL